MDYLHEPIAISNSSSVLNQIVQTIEATDDNAKVEQVVKDIKEALDLFMHFRESAKTLHPAVWNILKLLI